MNVSPSKKETVTWEQLEASLAQLPADPQGVAWNIYRYMSANVSEQMSSEVARTMLLTYMKLPVQRPSLLHSLMLGVALKMSEVYHDFRLPSFLKMWGVHNLRADDMAPSQGKDGKRYAALIDKVTAAFMTYHLRRPTDAIDNAWAEKLRRKAVLMGYMPIRQMVAVKLFETKKDNRTLRNVKLVGTDGTEILADSHVFECPPWQIVGRMYDVLPRRVDSGNVRVVALIPSSQPMERVFPTTIGYVESYDAKHIHFHIFDNQSRHFVAESPLVKPQVGEYVRFCPIIPAVDKFKSAMVVSREDRYKAREQFGPVSAKVQFINKEKDYFQYITDGQQQGFGKLSKLPATCRPGDTIRLIIFLKRGMDGQKRPYVAEAY